MFVFKFKIRVDIGPNRQVVNYIPSTLLAGYDLRCMLQDARSGALLSPFLSFNTFLTIAAKKEKMCVRFLDFLFLKGICCLYEIQMGLFRYLNLLYDIHLFFSVIQPKVV